MLYLYFIFHSIHARKPKYISKYLSLFKMSNSVVICWLSHIATSQPFSVRQLVSYLFISCLPSPKLHPFAYTVFLSLCWHCCYGFWQLISTTQKSELSPLYRCCACLPHRPFQFLEKSCYQHDLNHILTYCQNTATMSYEPVPDDYLM